MQNSGKPEFCWRGSASSLPFFRSAKSNTPVDFSTGVFCFRPVRYDQKATVTPVSQVLSTVAVKLPNGWFGLMPNLLTQ